MVRGRRTWVVRAGWWAHVRRAGSRRCPPLLTRWPPCSRSLAALPESAGCLLASATYHLLAASLSHPGLSHLATLSCLATFPDTGGAQEPRFLLPMALPMALLFARCLQDGTSRARCAALALGDNPTPSGHEGGVGEHARASSGAARVLARESKIHPSLTPSKGKRARAKSPGAAPSEGRGTARGTIALVGGPGHARDTGADAAARPPVLLDPVPVFSKWKVAGWLLFNALLVLFFGGLHQAGVSRALLWLARLPPGDRSLLWTHTYMPPVASLLLAPLAMRKGAASTFAGKPAPQPVARWVSEDLAGAPVEKVVQRLEAMLKPGREVYVVSPGSLELLPELRKRLVGGSGRGALEAISDVIREEERRQESAALADRLRAEASVHEVAQHLSQADAEVEVADRNKAWVCPLSNQLMRDPVVAADGHSYEREAIATLFAELRARGRELRSPVTERILESRVLTPNRVLQINIQALSPPSSLSSLTLPPRRCLLLHPALSAPLDRVPFGNVRQPRGNLRHGACVMRASPVLARLVASCAHSFCCSCNELPFFVLFQFLSSPRVGVRRMLWPRPLGKSLQRTGDVILQRCPAQPRSLSEEGSWAKMALVDVQATKAKTPRPGAAVAARWWCASGLICRWKILRACRAAGRACGPTRASKSSGAESSWYKDKEDLRSNRGKRELR